jgi:branched-chain amino acid transport system ATP-binding protein
MTTPILSRENEAAEQAKAILDVEGLEVRRGGRPILRDVDLRLGAGESLAILGRNGAGKTTFAEAIAGIISPSRGRIVIDGQRTSGMPAHKVARLGVALVPEGRGLFPNLTVRENLAMGGHNIRWWWGGPPESAFTTVWEVFPDLVNLTHRKVGTLSGGQQQMVAVGRAMMSSPRLLVLDEPTAGLSPQMVEGMCAHLAGLLSSGFSVLLIEQNVDVAIDVCKEMAILAQGRVIARGPAEELSRSDVFTEALFSDRDVTVTAADPSLSSGSDQRGAS